MVDTETPKHGRPRTPDGRRKLVTARVSEPKMTAIDTARGEMSRSAWVEAAIDAYLAPRVPVWVPAQVLPAAHPEPVYVNTEPDKPVYGNDEAADYQNEPFEEAP